MDVTIGRHQSTRSARFSILSNRSLAIASLVTATILWGSSYAAAKSVINTTPPFTLALLRLLIALAALAPIFWKTGRRPLLSKQTAFLGLTGVAGMNALNNIGIRETTAANASVVLAGGFTVITSVLAVFVLRERFTLPVALGVAGSICGTAFVALSGHGSVSARLGRGDVLILGAAACFAIYTIAGRTAFQGDILSINAGALIFGCLMLLPFVIRENAHSVASELTQRDLLTILFLGAAVTGGTSLLWAYSLRHLGAAESAVLCALEPVIGVLLATVLLNERFGPGQFFGTILIVASCLLAVNCPEIEKINSNVRRLAIRKWVPIPE